MTGGVSPARVLLVSGPVAGGIRRHLESLAAGLPSRGFMPALAAPAAVDLSFPGGRLPFEVADRPRPLRDLSAVGTLRRASRAFGTEVVHAQGIKAALLTLLAFPGGQPPVVLTFQNVWHGGALEPLLRALLPRARAAVCITRAVRESLERRGLVLPSPAVIPNGVDLAALPLRPDGSPGGPLTAAFLGRLTEEKGVPELLDLARRLGEAGEYRLLVAGDGPLRPQVEAAAARGLLRYLGPVPEVVPLYHAADVVLMPSRSEGQGLTAVEAMACGVPVIASRVGGLPEVVQDGRTGRLVPCGDLDVLLAALGEVARQPDRGRAWGRAGRERVREEFTVERMLDRLAAVYRSARASGA